MLEKSNELFSIPASTTPIVTGVTSVNGRKGAVFLDKSDVQLSNVDNTSDLDKPISTATQTALDEKQDVLIAGDGIKIIDNVITCECSGGESTFTNDDPSVIEVGGIKAGSTFDNASLEDLFNQMLYPELNPTLSNPYHSFSENVATLVEVGSTHNITFTSTFNRGSISPAYGTSGYRAGQAISYVYNGVGLPTEPVENTTTRDTQSITLTIDTPRTESWTSLVRYQQGEQPKTSKGNDFGTPLSAGSTTQKSVSVTAVYPHYATSQTITDLTKQSLTNGQYFEVSFVGEDDLGNKQTIDYVQSIKSVTGIEFYNTAAGNKWEWLNGSRENSLTAFSESLVFYDGVQYRRFTNTSGKVGARNIRFYIN